MKRLVQERARVADVLAVAASGAAYAGFVFFPKSPRHLTVDQARPLALAAPVGLAKVALSPRDAQTLIKQLNAGFLVSI